MTPGRLIQVPSESVPLNLGLGRGPLAPRAGGLRIRATHAFRIFIDIRQVRHFDGGAVVDSRAPESLRSVSQKCDWTAFRALLRAQGLFLFTRTRGGRFDPGI